VKKKHEVVTTCDVCRGACCEVLVQTCRQSTSHPDHYEFLRARSIAYLSHERVVLPSPCPLLSKSGRCMVYATRPEACRDFPLGGAACLEIIGLLRPQILE
jgi:Fe-S-cluster containining protein